MKSFSLCLYHHPGAFHAIFFTCLSFLAFQDNLWESFKEACAVLFLANLCWWGPVLFTAWTGRKEYDENRCKKDS
jgi:hypothetical protein